MFCITPCCSSQLFSLNFQQVFDRLFQADLLPAFSLASVRAVRQWLFSVFLSTYSTHFHLLFWHQRWSVLLLLLSGCVCLRSPLVIIFSVSSLDTCLSSHVTSVNILTCPCYSSYCRVRIKMLVLHIQRIHHDKGSIESPNPATFLDYLKSPTTPWGARMVWANTKGTPHQFTMP